MSLCWCLSLCWSVGSCTCISCCSCIGSCSCLCWCLQGNKNRSVNELLEPKVNWREQLRDFVNATCKNKDKTSWKRPHKRFIGHDIYMPSMIGESIGKVVIGVDTSGSIRDKVS